LSRNPFAILIRAFFDAFRPQMLGLTLLALGLSIAAWIVMLWLFMGPLSSFANYLLGLVSAGDLALPLETDSAFLDIFKSMLVMFLVFGVLWPIVASTAVMLASLYATPAVVSFLTKTDFPHLKEQGNASFFRGIWVAFKSVLVFLLLWVCTLPLWLIPGVALVLPILLTGYLLVSVMRFDVLSSHATVEEINRIAKRDGGAAWILGVVCAFLSFIPPIFLIMPVMSSLAFARHYFLALQHEREQPVQSQATYTIHQ
jgi:CysZ protein